MATVEHPSVNMDIALEVLEYIKSSESCSFDAVYMHIFEAVENKEDLKPTINYIIDTLMELPVEGENELDMIFNKTDAFCRSVEILISVFLYYEMSLDSEKESSKISNLATSQILSQFFYLESTRAALKNCVATAVSFLLNAQSQIPEKITRVAFYIFAISGQLYEEIFNTTFSTQLNFYISAMRIEQTTDEIEMIDTIYNTHMSISAGIEHALPPTTTKLLRESLSSNIIAKEKHLLTSQNFIGKAIENENPRIHELYTIMKLGTQECQKMFAAGVQNYLKSRLEAIDKSDDFSGFCNDVIDNFMAANKMNEESFDGQLSAEIKSAFVHFLDEARFADKLCEYHDQIQEPLESISVLSQFLATYTDFEDRYSHFLARRLLLGMTTVEKEKILMQFFKDNGVGFEQVEKMLDDFNNAKRVQTRIDDTDISIIVINTFNWRFLQPINFRPTPFFNHLFVESLNTSDIIKQTQESQGIDCYTKLVITPTDSYSTVEFSNGTTSFELTFFHANIVQLVMEATPEGGIKYNDIKKKLQIKSDEYIRNSIEFLVKKKILVDENDVFKFVGPPDVSSTFPDESNEIHRRTVETVQFTNCNDQIEAAIYRFLKSRRSAQVDEIKKFVFSQLTPQFNVTNDGIETCIRRLTDKEYITTHGTKSNSYKIKKT